jgi:hypothetical protein
MLRVCSLIFATPHQEFCKPLARRVGGMANEQKKTCRSNCGFKVKTNPSFTTGQGEKALACLRRVIYPQQSLLNSMIKECFMAKTTMDSKHLAIAGVAGLMGYGLVQVSKGTAFGSVLMWLCILITIGFVIFVVLMLLRNKAVNKASPAELAAARQFIPEPNAAVIYLFRKQYMGMLMGFDVALNGALIGQTRGYCFYRLVVAPGVHIISGEAGVEPVSVTVGVGQIAFVEQSLTGKSKPRYQFEWTPDIAGAQAKINTCKMYLPTQS